jgi:carbohydrate-binding DOMON domain-containing protein
LVATAGTGTLSFERSTINVPTTIETRINTSTAFTTDSSNSPMLKPTTVAANVAAACGMVRPSITCA